MSGADKAIRLEDVHRKKRYIWRRSTLWNQENWNTHGLKDIYLDICFMILRKGNISLKSSLARLSLHPSFLKNIIIFPDLPHLCLLAREQLYTRALHSLWSFLESSRPSHMQHGPDIARSVRKWCSLYQVSRPGGCQVCRLSSDQSWWVPGV